MKNYSLFKNTNENKLSIICKNLKKEKYDKGEIVFLENTIGNKFYIISKGTAKILKKNKFLREIQETNFFGEQALIENENRSCTVQASSNLECYTLDKSQFFKVLDKSAFEFIKYNMKLQNSKVKLEDLNYINFLGKGKYSQVGIVHDKHYIYAIKYISKKLIMNKKTILKYITQEKNILLRLDHPLIVKLVKTFKNQSHFFFLLEFVNGKNFKDLTSKKKFMHNLKAAQFYSGLMLLIIDYLNRNNVIYRDLKPNNFVLDALGYLKLIDFGSATYLQDYTYTLIGTPHYMAPEVMLGNGYGKSCDYWSLGICLFEIYYGYLPFSNNSNDIMEVYKTIINK